jgi:formamidopyrimidine-DNA glycosylase
MIELPEAGVLAKQINQTIKGKIISEVIAAQTPHKFAFFTGDPQKYKEMLNGRTIGTSEPRGGLVEILAGEFHLVFSDGALLKFIGKGETEPLKHQLLIRFKDSTSLSASVQMYASLSCIKPGTYDNPYYKVAGEKPSPLTAEFDRVYFDHLFGLPDVPKLSLKAFLATEQRVPGLGNGVLQDILFVSGLQPRKKTGTLSDKQKEDLYQSIKSTLHKMAEEGGRDTEKDLFGNPGQYSTLMSKNNCENPCPRCGGKIIKEAYMGGSVYYCPTCQQV